MLEIKTALQIAKPKAEVYNAIIDPEQMKHYFISEGSGMMDEGKTVSWKFPEFDEYVPVKVLKLIPNKLISFEWEGAAGQNLKVEISLAEMPGRTTLVKVTEGKMAADDMGIQWFGGNTEGWANFLACLKAYLEHGINLRKGGFDFMKE
ncbi:SRPBCC domain-containing protein [Salegentibacter sp. JZCK2]|uniref:SRPBCC domain-containing protein n=1 Tax=Salegentibacter tibetensis TaxID=2873600 RepID=UPI001CCE286A|nr:SRPBCC domain-containing protein [Salegentibacter tibetensis]MBZ9731496.1 SRPBCC domain-containing protein [Salegentibacter tibetensis]